MRLCSAIMICLCLIVSPAKSDQIELNVNVDLSEFDPRLREVIGYSAAPAFFASLHQLCGSTRVDVFQAAWAQHLDSKMKLTSEEISMVHQFFNQMRQRPEGKIDEGSKNERVAQSFCVQADLQPELIERGIAGDFSGFTHTGKSKE